MRVIPWARIALPLGVLLAASIAAPPRSTADDGATGAATQAGSSTPAPSPPQVAPTDLGKSAEEAAALLRHLTESLSDTAAFSALQAEVAAEAQQAATRWNETSSLLKEHLRPAALDSLTSAWTALRNELEDVRTRIDVRARRCDADVETLTKLHDSWTRSLELGRSADAPATVLARAQGTLAAIDATRPAIEQRRAQVLVLQDAASRSLETCDDALARIDEARGQALEQIFDRQQPPIWQLGRRLDTGGGEQRAAAAISNSIDNVRIYARTYAVRLLLSALIVLALMLALRRVRPMVTSPAPTDGVVGPPGAVFRTPYAAGVLLGLLLSQPLRPMPPVAFQHVMLLIVTSAAVLVMRTTLPAAIIRAVYAFGVLLAINLALQLVTTPPGLQQIIMIVEMAVAAALLFWVSGQLGTAKEGGPHSQRFHSVGQTLIRALGVGCGVSAAVAVGGYLDMADFLGTGLFYAFFLAFGLVALRLVVDDLVVLGLSKGLLARLHVIARHRDLMAPRLGKALDVAGALLWIWFVLRYFELLDPVRAMARAVLDARLQVGELDLPVARVFGFAAVVIGIYLTTRIVVIVLEEDVYSRMTLPRGVPYALSTLTRYGLLLAGFLLALGTLGLDLTRITVLVSALGLGIGFGLQQIMNNFISGLILLFERPVQVGDSIELGSLTGDVVRIGIRSTTLRTSHGAEVIVPNSQIIEEKVTNWTLSDRRRRIDLGLTVSDDIDADQVIALFRDIAGRDERVTRSPGPEALLVRIGDGAVDFELRVWTDDPHWMRLRSDLAVAMQRALREARRTVDHG